MGFYVPEMMRKAQRWGLWRLEDQGKGKLSKVPYSAVYKGMASPTNKTAWTGLERALNAYKYGEYSGLGFAFFKGDGLVFIDLDDCVTDSGELTKFAADVLELFPNTYTEYSQSEKGLHLIVRGEIPKAYKAKGIEIYNDGRYMAFTGNAHTQAEPQEAQNALNELCSMLDTIKAGNDNERPQRAPERYTNKGEELDLIIRADSEILEAANKGRGGHVFSALWAGNWAACGFESQSVADMRLMGMLYYYSRNKEQTRRLFLLSGLGQREKALRGDYIERTLTKAIEGTTERRSSYGVYGSNSKQAENQRKRKVYRRW